MLAGRISWCRVCNSTPAVIPIFGKRGFVASLRRRALWAHLPFLHHMPWELGLGLMKWRCLFCSCFRELRVRLPGAEQSCGTGRWQRTGRNVTVPSLSCSDCTTLLPICTMCWLLHGGQRERFGVFCLYFVYSPSGTKSCRASGLTLAMQFPDAWGDVCLTLQFCHVIKT